MTSTFYVDGKLDTPTEPEIGYIDYQNVPDTGYTLGKFVIFEDNVLLVYVVPPTASISI